MYSLLGGALLTPSNGTLNEITERCDIDMALTDQQVFLELEVNSSLIQVLDRDFLRYNLILNLTHIPTLVHGF